MRDRGKKSERGDWIGMESKEGKETGAAGRGEVE